MNLKNLTFLLLKNLPSITMCLSSQGTHNALYNSYCITLTQNFGICSIIVDIELPLSRNNNKMFLFLFLHFSVSNLLLFSMVFAVVHSMKGEKSSNSWSECSKTCGEGTKAKLVCKNEEKCEEIVVICNLMPCPRK